MSRLLYTLIGIFAIRSGLLFQLPWLMDFALVVLGGTLLTSTGSAEDNNKDVAE